jgi:hypothetical protein
MINKRILNNAILNNDINMVESLLINEVSNSSDINKSAIDLASRIGHFNILNIFLNDKRFQVIKDSCAIVEASRNGHVKVVKLLLKDKRFSFLSHKYWTIEGAVESGHTSVVKILLMDERFNPSDRNNHCIIYASDNPDDFEMVRLLWKDERVKQTLENDDLKLYNKLILEDIKNKIGSF